ncbi:MAG TPA: glycosyltransferase, partial [Actinomycetota bacterium]|nr:glycosyltransferase [Actinomycetota bacterium]
QFGHSYTAWEKVVKATKVVYSFEAQRQLRRLVVDRRPDVAHIHNIYHHLSPAILPVLKELGIPAVMTAHDLKIVCPNNKMLNATGICERCKGRRYYHAILNRCVLDSVAASVIVAVESTLHHSLGSYSKNLDAIVVPSRFFIDKFVEWGWPREKFVHVPNFVDADRFETSFEPGKHFVYFGRLAREKGLFTLIRAVARARVPLVLVGTGPIEDELRRLAASIEAPVEFAGYKTGAALYSLVRGARATVLPSEWYENSPISVLESLAMGKPVVGARIGGIPEMVRDQETGWLFESGNVDALEASLRAAHDCPASEVAELGRKGRRLVETEFSRERYASTMLDIYATLGVGASPTEVGLCPSIA